MANKLVVFDLDGTLTSERSVWRFIHESLGTWEGRGEGHLQAWLNGDINYQEFARVDALEWKGIHIDKIRDIAAKIKILPGAQVVVSYLQARGDTVAIISSGLDVLAGRVADELGIEIHYSNKLKTDKDGLLTGEVDIIVPAERNGEYIPNGKGKILTDIQEKTDINPDDTIAIGDSDSDIPMFLRSGESYAINHATDGAKSAANFYAANLARLLELLQETPELKSGLNEDEDEPEASDC